MAGEEFNQGVTFGGEISAAPHNTAWDNIEDWLNERLALGTSGQLIVCDSNGDPRPISLSGDGTLTAAGELAIANGRISQQNMDSEANNVHRLIHRSVLRVDVDAVILSSGVAGPFPAAANKSAVSYDDPDGTFPTFHYDPAWFDVTGRATDFLIRGSYHSRESAGTTAELRLYELETDTSFGDQLAGAALEIPNIPDDRIGALSGVQIDAPDAAGVFGWAWWFDGSTDAALDLTVSVDIYLRYPAS